MLVGYERKPRDGDILFLKHGNITLRQWFMAEPGICEAGFGESGCKFAFFQPTVGGESAIFHQTQRQKSQPCTFATVAKIRNLNGRSAAENERANTSKYPCKMPLRVKGPFPARGSNCHHPKFPTVKQIGNLKASVIERERGDDEEEAATTTDGIAWSIKRL